VRTGRLNGGAAAGGFSVLIYRFDMAVLPLSPRTPAGSVRPRLDEDIGKVAKVELSPLGYRPYRCPEVVSAWWRLRGTQASVTGLFDTVYLVRRMRAKEKNQSTRGRLSGDAQDLLRSAVVFTSAGLDAALAALLEGAVPILAIDNAAARGKFDRYVELVINATGAPTEFLEALKHADPRPQLVDVYISGLAKASFQGSGDVKDRACASLGITNQQVPRTRIVDLDPFFTARNDIAHRLDQLPPTAFDAAPPRQQRNQDDVGRMCDEVLLLVRDIIKATAGNIAACRGSSV